MNLLSQIEIAVVAPYPTLERVKEGWMSRINAVDSILKPRNRLYIHFAEHHVRNRDDQIIHQDEHGWEICLSPTDVVHQEIVDSIVRSVRCIYVHTVHLAEFIQPWLSSGNFIVDFHGVVPEEEIMMGHPERAPKYEALEQEVLREARTCVMVTEAMRRHYAAKYPHLTPRVIILPIVESIKAVPQFPRPNSTELPVRVLYAGGIQAWQNVDAMLNLAVDTRDFATFTFLSYEWQLVEERAEKKGCPPITSFRFCRKADLISEYAKVDFGLVLRDDTAVNRVASPTKLYEYLALGVIPIVRAPSLGDFEEFNYCYITEEEFRQSFFPDKASRYWMAQQNLRVVERLQQRFIDGARSIGMVLDQNAINTASWRITRPLRVAMRTVRNRGLTPQDHQRISEILRHVYHAIPLPLVFRRSLRAGSSFIAGKWSGWRQCYLSKHDILARNIAVPIQPQGNADPDIFVWAIIDWHFRIQRPQHLARELAKAGKRVFYISVQFIDDSRPGFNVEPIDDSGRLFQIHFHVNGAPPIYWGIPTVEARMQIQKNVGGLLNWTKSRKMVSLVQHPFWFQVARILPNARLVYDCMDHHEGFGGFSPELSSQEQALMRTADLVVVTSQPLDDVASKYNDQRAIIRNACEYERFANPPPDYYRDPYGDRQIIGYYGAIAPWFDVELVAALADRFPNCCVLLVGEDTCGARQRLQSHSNVLFVGEVEYDKLPYYLYGFAVCILPFHIVPLTLATNPVKVYEYLSAGKTVVATDLPDLRQLGDLVHTAPDRGAFSDAVAAALAELPDEKLVARRKAFARKQTWVHRAQELAARIRDLPEPLVSIIVITYNNLDLTETCLQSLEAYSDYGAMEIIVVDNASTDGTADYLTAWGKNGDGRRVILNQDNRGFAAANNQGLGVARGDYLVILNNDTHVTPGWLRTLVNHLRRDETIGLIGPVTNNIGNEARIEIEYSNMASMMERAAQYTRRHLGQMFDLRTAVFFCAMMPARVYQTVGPLDEAFGIGFFEDDDYCRRIEQAGYRIVCAEDVFVHHHLSASFNLLGAQKRAELLEQSRKIYEQKWGPWVPHSYRIE